MTTELKPCPFCGGKAETNVYGGTGAWSVKCSCGAEMYGLVYTEAEAIEAWNKRAAYEAEGYFFLPKPKEQLFYTTPLGIKETESGYVAQTGIQILEEAARRWADEINNEVLRSIIECWNTRAERTCQLLRLENEDVCSFCGYAEEVDSAYIPNNYCPSCGAKVIDKVVEQ